MITAIKNSFDQKILSSKEGLQVVKTSFFQGMGSSSIASLQRDEAFSGKSFVREKIESILHFLQKLLSCFGLFKKSEEVNPSLEVLLNVIDRRNATREDVLAVFRQLSEEDQNRIKERFISLFAEKYIPQTGVFDPEEDSLRSRLVGVFIIGSKYPQQPGDIDIMIIPDHMLREELVRFKRENGFIANHTNILAEDSLFREGIALYQAGKHWVDDNPLENLENSFTSQAEVYQAFQELPFGIQFEIKEKIALLIIKAKARENHFFEKVVANRFQDGESLEEEVALVGEACIFARAVRAEVQAQRA